MPGWPATARVMVDTCNRYGFFGGGGIGILL